MESETTPTNFSYICYIKIQVVYLTHFEWIIYQKWFCFLTYCSFGEYWFTNLCRSSKCSPISLCSIWKKKQTQKTSHLLLSLISLEKSKFWEAIKLRWNEFYKFLIFALNLKFYHWWKKLSIVFLDMSLTYLIHLKENVCQVPEWRI